ncbi:MAG: family 78 glycoside hydrolase catalytic domain [Lachnospiraceae bacterium]|nr:family 78 glycoside hydrolase catalytic domain [Lachnospiraceae bacterium]
MDWTAKWIKPAMEMEEACPVFTKEWSTDKPIKEAKLFVTALGVYEAELNGKRVGDFIMAPGWTEYFERLQYQEYDVTELLQEQNVLTVTVGRGWYRGRIGTISRKQKKLRENPPGLLAELVLVYQDESEERIGTDTSWQSAQSRVRLSEIYDGETYDACYEPEEALPAVIFDGPWNTLIAQQGPKVIEQERIAAARIFTTPKGETVVDFGQEITGYVEITVRANAGEIVELSHAEVMDKEGNFYTENYRSAKAKYIYICRDGVQSYKPKLTFYGFRYIRIDQFPGGVTAAKPLNFTAIVVHSDMKRTGYFRSSNPLLNRLFDNVIWGQKGNFLDVPTDCPQRDERLGWLGDAQVFAKTACLNYDAEQFFTKWLADMAVDQSEDGNVGIIIPAAWYDPKPSAAWGDAATICPWEVYMTYGNPAILQAQFVCMRKWVDFITGYTTTPYLWTGGEHYGDWLGLDAPSGSYKGSSRDDFIASAFYAYSTSLVIKAGHVLGKDVSEYEALYEAIKKAFQEAYPVYETQTECVLAVHFRLAPDCQAAAKQLAEMVKRDGHLMTGFVGTPYLLHALSDFGYTELAYELLLREEYPSWLYSVTKGATTIWEHWDGIMENGDFWSSNMNSFNHYAYGAVADWLYTVAAGIKPVEEAPGYAKVRIAPTPDKRLGWLKVSFESRHGVIRSSWTKADGLWKYEIETPVEAVIVIAGKEHRVNAGRYTFYSEIK